MRYWLSMTAALAISVTPAAAQTPLLDQLLGNPSSAGSPGRAAPSPGPASPTPPAAPSTPAFLRPPPPGPVGGANASVPQLIADARAAPAGGKSGEAEQALEMAESRLLNRSVVPSTAGNPIGDPLVSLLSQARQAIGSGDTASAMQLLDQLTQKLGTLGSVF